jgi:glycogen synthase
MRGRCRFTSSKQRRSIVRSFMTFPEATVGHPPRILMTADAVGGVWRYAIDLGRELTARGVQVTLAVMGPSPAPAQYSEARDARIELVDRPYRLEWMDDPWCDVEQAGVWLLDLERQLAPSVVHLNGYVHAALPWCSPVVVVAHSCVRTWWKAVRCDGAPSHIDRYTAKVAAGLAAAQVVVVPTRAMGAALSTEYGVPLTTHVIPNGHTGADESPRGTAAGTTRDGGKQDIVFAAGRLWDEAKNIAALCDVADVLPWPIYVAGEWRSPDGATPRLPSVSLLGRLPQHEMDRWYRDASIYALPARYEPFGLSILEAAAAECALVLGDIPSLRENWDGAAVFVDPDDRLALAGAIRGLIDRPGVGLELAQRARARAATFTIARTADHYLQLYQALIA